MSVSTSSRIDAAAFFQLSETLYPTELIDGQVIRMPAPTPQHQRLVFKIAKLIPNGEVFVAPNDVHLDAHNVLQPDVMWVAEGSACQETDKRFVGSAPELVVEVLSEATTRRDRKEKFASMSNTARGSIGWLTHKRSWSRCGKQKGRASFDLVLIPPKTCLRRHCSAVLCAWRTCSKAAVPSCRASAILGASIQ